MTDDIAADASTPADRSPHSLDDFFSKIEARLSEAAANAVAAQQQAWVTAMAAQNTGIGTLYALGTAAAGEATAEELGKGSTGGGG
jgi:Killing trait